MEQVREMSIAIAKIFSVKVPVETTKNFRKMKQKRSQHDQRIGKRQQHFFSLDALTNPKRHLISKNFFLSTFCQMTLLPSFQQSLRIITLPRKQWANAVLWWMSRLCVYPNHIYALFILVLHFDEKTNHVFEESFSWDVIGFAPTVDVIEWCELVQVPGGISISYVDTLN